MEYKAATKWLSPKIGIGILLLATASFNNWLLGFLYDRPLIMHGATVSELSVSGQPHAWLFRFLDITSGILFVTGALIIFLNQKGISRTVKVLLASMAVLGIANIFDALLPLQCVQTAQGQCSSPITLSLSHIAIPYHAYSSVIIGAVMYVFVPFGGLIYTRNVKNYLSLKLASLLNIGLGLITLLTTIFEYARLSAVNWHLVGPEQQLQMLLLGVWFLVFYRILYRSEYARSDN